MNNNVEDKIIIGKILSPHGIKGQLNVEALSDFPRRFSRGGQVWSNVLQRQLKITAVTDRGGILLVTFEGIEDRDCAQSLTGSYLYIKYDQLAVLPEGHYYHFQLEGLIVFDALSGDKVGELAEVLPYTANDVYVVKRSGAADLLLPALKSVVKKVDLEEGRMEVVIPAGLD